MSEPDFIHTLPSGAELDADPLSLHPILAEDLDRQTREMEEARAAAVLSGRDYLMLGGES